IMCPLNRTPEEKDPQRKSSGMSEEVKAEILASIRGDISKIIREEIRGALSEDLDALKADIKAVRAEIASNASTTRAEITSMKTDIEDVKSGLSTWSDEVSTLQTTVTELQSELAKLRDKCEDMEGRMRRGNIRIAGIDERPNSASPNEVSKIIKEVLKMDRDVKVDRSHRTATSKKPRDSPRVIIAKLHNDGDAADILRRETHLSDDEHKNLRKSWADKVYYSSHCSGRKRGVAILIHRQINFTETLVHKDREGRLILVNGTIDGTAVSFINVYAPNEDIPGFVTSVFNTIAEHSSGLLIMGGDFNCVMSNLDRQPISQTPISRMGKMLKNLSTEAGLVDIWRSKFPKKRNFTFYSNRHASYSRIDYFFTAKAELHRIEDITILPITISDHAPVVIQWDIGLTTPFRQWRLNASLLNDKDFIALIKTEFKNYLDTNRTPETSPIMLWDCGKAYLRGSIISYATARKRQNAAKQQELEERIRVLEYKHKQGRSPNILNDLNTTRRELHALLSEKIEGNLCFVKQQYYENGNRASRLLAFRLKKQQSSNVVQKLNLGDKSIVKPRERAEMFAEFYKILYQDTDTCSDEASIANYLRNINVSELPDTVAKELDRPTEEGEIKQVISSLKNNKCPGPDGFINEFYKCFGDILTPPLLDAYRYALETKTMAPSWSYATIVVLHKEGKDPTNCGSYKPLSMLNGDVRILTTILARRLNYIITQIIHPDQTRFITGRHYGNNLGRLLNIISHQKEKKSNTTIISLDAQKAFDRVSWKYLIQTLKRFKFGPNFVDWIHTLYSSPQAAVRVNGFRSARFNLERGCRQGCPLSPLLFAVSIEPLAQLIRDDDGIRGILIGTEEHKISLYADDVLLYLTEPASSIPHLKGVIYIYGHFSGYKINVDKTEAMDVNGNVPLMVNKILDIIKNDLERWAALPLSLFGCIETIRMNVLPRLLYLFQMLPIVIPKSTFVELDKIISKFIWQNKRPQIKYKTIQRSKAEGGLNLPVLKYYFWAAQLKPLISWIQNDTHTRWLSIEQTMSPEPLKVLPFLDISIKGLSLWTRTTLNIWNKVRAAFNIGHIKSFTPNSLDKGFAKWADQGLMSIHQLIDTNNLVSFEQLRRHFQLQKNNFFRYLQLRSFLTTHKEWERVLNPTPIENLLTQFQKGEGDKNLITKFYKVFLSMSRHEPVQTKQRWEAETVHQTTNSNMWREFKWKIISRYFRPPDVVAKMDPRVPSLCWRNCGTAIPNHTHIFWSCPKLQIFWDKVYRTIKQILQEVIPKDPTVALLGIFPAGIQGRAKSYLLNIFFVAALKCITIKWMQLEPPTYNAWVQKVGELYQMEKITYLLRLQRHVFSLRWDCARALLR
uniref:Reverse transcriptase domain-containing protein n=1 Tax=Pygocentrus nattereri TaxID=42514 RepID=A0AAR2K0V3_PYGNA